MKRLVVAAGVEGGEWLLSCAHETSDPASPGTTVDCRKCDSRSLPASVTTGRKTPSFMAETVPAGLLRDHRTTTWARLEIETGSITFVEDEPRWVTSVGSGESVVIIPDRAHRIEVSDNTRFAVQFFDLPPALTEVAAAAGDVQRSRDGTDR